MGNERLSATRQRLQREHLATRVRAFSHKGYAFMLPGETYSNAVRDRVAQELFQRPAFHSIVSQIAVLGIAFQQPLALQETSDSMSDGVRQVVFPTSTDSSWCCGLSPIPLSLHLLALSAGGPAHN